MSFLNFTLINPILLLLGDKSRSSQSIMWVLGGIFYFISDNLLGMTKFGSLYILGERKINSFIIMVTDYLAQYLIPLGTMNIFPKKDLNIDDESLI